MLFRSKAFGPDDADALKLIKPYLSNIVFYTQDKKGMGISVSRISHMGFPVVEANTERRLEDIKKFYGFENTIYMGDSFLDAPILNACKYGIATKTSSPYAKHFANYITERVGGDRAVSEAVFWILRKVLNIDQVELPGGFKLWL